MKEDTRIPVFVRTLITYASRADEAFLAIAESVANAPTTDDEASEYSFTHEGLKFTVTAERVM